MTTDNKIQDSIDYHENHMASLIGATLTAATVSVDDEGDGVYFEVWPVLIFTKPDGTTIQVEVSRDPEGNGPGHLFIEGV